MPLDKNGDLIFDVDEARDIHNNAVEMLSRAIGVDVLTTFTDVDSIDLSDKNTTATQDDLSKIERTVYNNLGISRNLFNTDGNLSLEKSILNDESTARNLLLQFNVFFRILLLSSGVRTGMWIEIISKSWMYDGETAERQMLCRFFIYLVLYYNK